MIIPWMSVVIREVVLSVSREGPLSSTDINIVWTVSDTAEKGMIFNRSTTSMKWEAAREE